MFTKETLQEMLSNAEFSIKHRAKELLKATINFEFNPSDFNKREIEAYASLLAEAENLKAKLEAILNHTENTIDVTPTQVAENAKAFAIIAC